MKKVGIVTYHRADNYGAVLQNMALLRAIQLIDSDVNAITLDYRNMSIEAMYNSPFYKCFTKNPLKYIAKLARNISFHSRLIVRRKNFEKFRINYLNLSTSYTRDELLKKCPDYDMFITGSDQVWNAGIAGNRNDDIYSLGFVKNARKISYAGSSGSSSMLAQGTLEYIANLDEISVREQELQEFLSKKLNRKVRVDVDPVFLLDAKSWNAYLPKERVYSEKFIFAYSISQTSEVIRIARKIAKKTGYKIIYVNNNEFFGKYGKSKYGANPLDFVRYIRDAEIVLASSFHATAFSIIFGKKFITVPHKSTGSRVTGLLTRMNLSERAVYSYEEYSKSKIDYNKDYDANAVLDSYRTESLQYLAEQLKMLRD